MNFDTFFVFCFWIDNACFNLILVKFGFLQSYQCCSGLLLLELIIQKYV